MNFNVLHRVWTLVLKLQISRSNVWLIPSTPRTLQNIKVFDSLLTWDFTTLNRFLHLLVWKKHGFGKLSKENLNSFCILSFVTVFAVGKSCCNFKTGQTSGNKKICLIIKFSEIPWNNSSGSDNASNSNDQKHHRRTSGFSKIWN